MKNVLRALWKGEQGQDLVEYALLLFLLGLALPCKGDLRFVAALSYLKSLGRWTEMGRFKFTPADRDAVRREVAQLMENIVVEEPTPMTSHERERFFQEVMDEVFGLGPLEPLFEDPAISDILVNDYKTVFVERDGLLELTAVQFRDEDHLRQIMNRVVSAVGRRVDESSPMVDARLPDGSRVNAIIPPLALDGPNLSIRRFGRVPLTAEDLLRNKSLTPQMLELLSKRPRAPECSDFRRQRFWKNYLAQRSLLLHFRPGAHCHHRRCGGAATEAEACGTAGNASSGCGGERRGAPAATGDQFAAHASRPHYRRRGAWR